MTVLDRLPTVSPTAYRRITLVALWSLVFIVVTGAGVRLTESGLGCSTWPGCEPDAFVPRDETSLHDDIEAVNRLITGVVSVAVAAAVLGSLRRTPRRRDLTLLSWGLVAGVIGQILLGAVVVFVHVHPIAVQGHFVLSAVLVADAVVLHHRARLPDGPDGTARTAHPEGSSRTRQLSSWAIAAAAAVILAGTIVTGTGPHGGDADAERLEWLSLTRVAQIHSILTWIFLVLTVVIARRMHREMVSRTAMERVTALLTVIVGQGAVGYLQYATGIPEALVALHIFGSMLVWAAVIRLALTLHTPVPRPDAVEVEEPPSPLAAGSVSPPG